MTDKNGTEQTEDQKMDTTNTPGTSQEVAASILNVRLPAFWSNNPKLWFLTAEIQFSMQKITKDETKFLQTIASLSPEATETIQDFLEQPPPSHNRYEILKALLIERNSMSEERKLEELLDKSDMGDLMPSEVLRKIKTTAGNTYTEGLIKSLWLRKLPEYIRIALVPLQEDKNNDQLAKISDKLFEATKNQAISAVTHQSRPQKQQTPWQDKSHFRSRIQSTNPTTLEERLTNVEYLLENLTRSRSYSRERPFSFRSRNRSNSRIRQRQPNLCWYHRKFGTTAKKCTYPCKHKKSSNEQSNKTDITTPNK